MAPDPALSAGQPPTPPPVTGVDRMAVAFSHLLRGQGLDVPVGCVTVFAAALGAVGVGNRSSVYWAGRATIVRQPEDLRVYDRSFEAFWLGRPLIEAQPPAAPASGPMVATPDPHGGEAPEEDDGAEEDRKEQPTMALRYSATEVLGAKDFAAYSRSEFAEAHRLMADLRLAGALRRSRRWRRAGAAGATKAGARRPDLRRTVRASLGSGGEPIHRLWLAPAQRPRRVVLLCDVSGSMEPYARALLRFAHAAVVARGAGRVEVFAVGTRLTRLTRELTWRDPDVALAQAARAVADWSGGTRLGEGLRAFNDRYGVRGMARGGVVVILSDGWDRGDPAALANEMARLHRVAYQVVWVNPLLAGPGYVPLAQGMAAALPHVDRFVPGHSLRALKDLV
ncbi:MAG: vWA domain-containing protein, partial [Acidimicrobiales bacterium]